MRIIKGKVPRKPKNDPLYQGLLNIGALRCGDKRIGLAFYGFKNCRYIGVIPNISEPLEYVRVDLA